MLITVAITAVITWKTISGVLSDLNRFRTNAHGEYIHLRNTCVGCGTWTPLKNRSSFSWSAIWLSVESRDSHTCSCHSKSFTKETKYSCCSAASRAPVASRVISTSYYSLFHSWNKSFSKSRVGFYHHYSPQLSSHSTIVKLLPASAWWIVAWCVILYIIYNNIVVNYSQNKGNTTSTNKLVIMWNRSHLGIPLNVFPFSIFTKRIELKRERERGEKTGFIKKKMTGTWNFLA